MSLHDVGARYDYVLSACGSPALVFELAFRAHPYTPSPDPADPLNALDAAGVPLWQRNARTALEALAPFVQSARDGTLKSSIRDALFARDAFPLSDDQTARTAAFLDACGSFLTGRSHGTLEGEEPRTELALAIDPAAADCGDVTRMDIALVIACAESSVTASIEAGPRLGPEDDALVNFARAFETVFAAPGRHLRLAGSAEHLWVLRFAEPQSNSGIRLSVSADAGFYAALPVAKEPLSGTVAVTPDGRTQTFSNVDLNLWLRSAAASIEAFLRRAPGDTQVRAAAQSIRATAVRTLAPVLTSSGSGQNIRDAASRALLEAPFDETVAVFPARMQHDAGVLRLFGTVQCSEGGESPLQFGSACIDGSTLVCAFSAKDPERESYYVLRLAFAITHAEPGAGEARVPLLGDPVICSIGSESIRIPAILRSLPPAPALNAQTARAPDGDTPDAAGCAKWTYVVDYQGSPAAQDAAGLTLLTHAAPVAPAAASGESDAALFAALARFATLASAAAEGSGFGFLAAEVARAYASWSEAQHRAPAVSAASHSNPTYRLQQRRAAGSPERGVLDVLLVEGGERLPAPAIDLISADAVRRSVRPPIPQVVASYEYVRGDGSPLTFAELLGLTARSAACGALNLFALPCLRSAMRTHRNKILGDSGLVVMPAFRFQSADAAFAEAVLPQAAVDRFEMSRYGSTLEVQLEGFFSELFAGAGALEIAARIAASYSYELQPDVRTSLPILASGPAPLDTAAPRSFCEELARGVMEWFERSRAGSEASGEIAFSVTLYASGRPHGDVPLLRIESLFTPVRSLLGNPA